MKNLNQIKQELLTEEGKFLQLQDNICVNIQGVLGSMGFLSDGFFNESSDAKAKRWVWKNRYGIKVEFTNPTYKDVISLRKPPIEKNRKAESALLLNTSNRSGASVTRNISKEVAIMTNAKILESNTFNFNVTAGIEAGIEGVEANFGARVLAKFEASFGGSFLRQWESDKGTSSSRKLEDSLVLEPHSEYRISATVDKIELEQEIEVTGNVDFAITVKIPDFTKHNSKAFNADIQALKPNQDIKAEDIRDLCRNFVGITGDIYKSKSDKDKLLNQHRVLSGLNYLLREENRKITTNTKLSYNDAGDSHMTIERVGTWERKDGKWGLNLD